MRSGTRVSAAARTALLCIIVLVASGWERVHSLERASGHPAARTMVARPDPLALYSLRGDTGPVHDPSIIRQGSTYYMFTTDVVGRRPVPSLRIRCSTDEQSWTACGGVFPRIPGWVREAVPGVRGLWAPDISYWGGLYHLYYSGSTLGSQHSVIGMATNVTLDASDPRYEWVDQGEVLGSQQGDDFNAIDPNIVVADGGRVFLSYGSYWSGIKQIELDPATGMVRAGAVRRDLATRPGVPNNPIEGASIVRHGPFYYLFVSEDYCCNRDVETDNYKEAVGRSTSPEGPFVDMSGRPMLQGGGTVILERNAEWNAPGGATAYIDPETGESLMVFHALRMTEEGAMYGWVKHIGWENDWPVLQP